MIEYIWKLMFSDYILERGLDYFDRGLVGVLLVKENTVSALVDGTMNYVVEIKFGRNGPVDFYCSCPYAEEKYTCKHMAAVLYAFEINEEALMKMDGYLKENSSEKMVMKRLWIW